MKRTLGVLSVAAILLAVLSAAQSSDGLLQGRYRIILMNGNTVEGDVTQRPDGSYLVENANGRKGITVTVRKAEVRQVVPIEEAKGADPAARPGMSMGVTSARRRAIQDSEIEEILLGIKANVDPEAIGVKREDMMAPLPLDEASVAEMVRLAGSDKKLVTDHFVMVYTGPDKAARALLTRLEAVWRWNVRFIEMNQLPARRPEHKLEIYFFHTFDEFVAHAKTAYGTDVSGGVLGYYRPDSNRSHFFEMATFPPVARRLEQAAQKGVPARDGRQLRNTVNRWVEYQNIEVIQHEAGHHIHFNIGLFPMNGLERESGIPRWLVEGTTMLFEFPPNESGAGIGTINHKRLYEFRNQTSGMRMGANEWKRFIIDDTIWFTNAYGFSYPIGWALVQYLWKEHREDYSRYMREVFGREPDFRMTETEREAEFEKFFGRVDDAWVKKFRAFVERLRFMKSRLPPEIF